MNEVENKVKYPTGDYTKYCKRLAVRVIFIFLKPEYQMGLAYLDDRLARCQVYSSFPDYYNGAPVILEKRCKS